MNVENKEEDGGMLIKQFFFKTKWEKILKK